MKSAAGLPETLGALRNYKDLAAKLPQRTVKDELRENLICRLQKHEPLFPGIVGFDDTVVPQVVNAVLSRHNFILLGLRGQAKTRLIRMLATLLDERIPYIAGCEIRDNPFAPICKSCRDKTSRDGRCHADRLAFARRALRGEAGHSRRHDCRYDRRHRSHQGCARGPEHRRRADGPLRAAAAGESWHFRHQRAARPGGKDSGGLVQHHAGRRRSD